MSEAMKKVREFERNLMREMLDKCTEEQRAFFKRMYPKGPNQNQIEHAFVQIENTMRKNDEKK